MSFGKSFKILIIKSGREHRTIHKNKLFLGFYMRCEWNANNGVMVIFFGENEEKTRRWADARSHEEKVQIKRRQIDQRTILWL